MHMEIGPLEFFKRLVQTPGPSGYEGPVQQVVREYAQPFADEVQSDLHGNLMLVANPQSPRRVMLAGHCDQIGLIVSHIDDSGFLYTQMIGGWDPQQLIGQRMVVWSGNGPIPAVIARKPIHLLTEEERKQVVKQKDLWLDIGASDKQDAESVIRIGDPVTLELGFQLLRNDLANAPAMDNRTGLWVVIEAFRRCRDANPEWGVYAVSTVQEEIGLRGARTSAFGIAPEVGIAVDVTHATDCPTIEVNQLGQVKLGSGPVIFRGPNMNHSVTDRLIEVAQQREIPYQLSASGRATPNDANALQVTRGGVATGLVSIPNRYMHSAVETVALGDLDQAADLLAAFVGSLSESDDFTP